MSPGVADTPGSGQPSAAGELAWHTLSAEEVLRSEGADGQRGLSSAEAASRARRFGPNKLAAAKAEPHWHAFGRQYRDPMQIVLLAAGIGSLYPLKQLGTGILLILLTLFNAVLGLHQEGKAAASVAALQKMMIITARVRRDGQLAEIPTGQLVPGDIVLIEAGDIVPADGRLLTAATLEVFESALTGESLPVAKSTDTVTGADTPLGDRTDMVYMNTNVTRGTGEFVITATGMATEVGHISGMLAEEQAVTTPLTRQLDRLSKQILVIAGIALVASMALNLARGDTFIAVFNAAVAFAIAAIPVALPAVVTTILAWGTEQLAKAGHEVVRCFVKGAPDQLLARAATMSDASAGPDRTLRISDSDPLRSAMMRRLPRGMRSHGHRPLFRAPCQPAQAGQRADPRPPARRGMGHHLAARPRGRPRRAADTNRRPAAPSHGRAGLSWRP